jgi:uncharacterized protein (UPF0297 family)
MFGLFKKKKKDPADMNREELIAHAQENAAKAREEIGDENIQKLADAIRRMDDPNYQSAGKQAREKIRTMDEGHIADNLKITLKETKK